MVKIMQIKTMYLKELVSILSCVTDEIKMVFGDAGLSVTTVDSGHVMMMDLNLSKEAFEDYKKTNHELCVDLDKMNCILKVGKPDDRVVLSTKGNKLIMTIGHITRNIALLDKDALQDPKFPNLNLDNELSMDKAEILSTIKASDDISDRVTLNILENDEFLVRIEGDTDNVELKIPSELLNSHKFEKPSKVELDLTLFGGLMKSLPSNDITLQLGNDLPISLESTFAHDNGKFKFIQAPRIESE